MQGIPEVGSYAPPVAADAGGRPPLTGRAAALADAAAQVGLILLAALSLFLFYKAEFVGLNNPDAMDFAQIGRNMSSGNGFTTYILRPLALSQGDNPVRQPDVTHGPLYPLVLAIAFGALGAKDELVVLVAGLFFVLTCPLIYQLGVRVFSRGLGVFAAAFYALNLLTLQFALSGVHITLYTFLFTGLLVVLYNLALAGVQSEAIVEAGGWYPLPRFQLVLAGVLCAGLYAVDFSSFPIAIAAFFAVLRWFRRQKTAAVFFLIPLLLIGAPILWRNHTLTGNAVLALRGKELAMHTEAHPGFELYRSLSTSASPGAGALVRKLAEGVDRILRSYPNIPGVWVFGFFLSSLFLRFDDEPANRLRSFVLAAFALLCAGMLPFFVSLESLASLTPALIVYGCAFLVFFLQQSPRRPLWWLAAGAAIALVGVFPTVREMVLVRKTEPVRERGTAELLGTASAMKVGEAALSDAPWLLAWYANRPAIWLPSADADVATLRKRFPTLRWMMLTEETRGFSQQWSALYGIFRQWNEGVVAAARARRQPQGPLQIRGGKELPPLFNALQGFVTIPPGDKTHPSVVLAVVPPPPAAGASRPADGQSAAPRTGR